MLRRLKIQNHALIQEADLSFKEGFHVFTGETGSGKASSSVLWDFCSGTGQTPVALD